MISSLLLLPKSSFIAFIADIVIKIAINMSGNPRTIANFCTRLSPPTAVNPMDKTNIAIAQLNLLYRCGSLSGSNSFDEAFPSTKDVESMVVARNTKHNITSKTINILIEGSFGTDYLK